MTRTLALEAARRAKQQLMQQYAGNPQLHGWGLGQRGAGAPIGVTVLCTSEEALQLLPAAVGQVPVYGTLAGPVVALQQPAAPTEVLVLRVADPAPVVAHLRAMGLRMQQEQHAVGPVHWSAQVGDRVLEVYPHSPKQAADKIRLFTHVPE